MANNIKEEIKTTKNDLRKKELHTILEQFDVHIMKLNKSTRSAKYRKMKQDPYSFFRGSAYLFYYDATNFPFSYHTPEDKPTWILGDLHADNFSGFQNEQGQMVFDVDDFDEGYLGSYVYDIFRMVVSIRLLGEQEGFTEEDHDEFVEAYLSTYIKQLKKFSNGEKDPVTRIFTTANTKGPVKKTLKKLENRHETHELEKQTFINESGERKFNLGKEKLSPVTSAEYKRIETAWDQYKEKLAGEAFLGDEYYEIKDIAKKTGAGIGATGLKRYYLLTEGHKKNDHTDNLILEAKEARVPIPAYFFPYDDRFWDEFENQGKRVVTTQNAMHHKADPHLGYFSMGNKDFYVRERSPYEKDIKKEYFKEKKDMVRTFKIMAKASAKIHARADQDIENNILSYHSEQEILKAIGNDETGFKKELSTWSRFYKKRVESDYLLFLDWLREYFYKK